MQVSRVVPMDANASGPVCPQAWRAYQEVCQELGHPSRTHGHGMRARRRLMQAAASVAASLGARDDEIIVTTGATEANAQAIFGTLSARVRTSQSSTGPRPLVAISSGLEHPSVRCNLDMVAASMGVSVHTVRVGRSGCLSPDEVEDVLRDASARGSVVLLTALLASNETGVVQPIAAIAELCSRYGVLLHTDATQAVGRLDVDVRALGIDLLSMSGHKVGAMAGTGALFVRRGLRLTPLLGRDPCEQGVSGGVAGVSDVAGAVSLAVALQHLPTSAERQALASRRDRLEKALCAALVGVEVIGQSAERLCNTASIRFAGCSGEGLMMALDVRGVAISTGSACSSGSVEPSAALRHMGLSVAEAKETVRFSLSTDITDADIEQTVAAVVDVVQRMRREPC